MPYYAVYKGNFGSQIYQNWVDAEKAVKGASGCKFKKFATQADAQSFLRDPSYTAPAATPPAEILYVYTDGSATLSTGKAGIGVYFPDYTQFNLSESFNQPPNTNQRAELWAIVRALQQIKTKKFANAVQLVYLYTDSQYAIGCATTWRKSWMNTDFRRNTIANKGIVQQLWAAIDASKYPVRFIWVKGHSDSAGNNAADQLATAGSALLPGVVL